MRGIEQYEQAVALDPESAEAHAAMAFVRDRYYSDSRGAQSYFERALAINPSYVTAYNLYGDTLRDLGEIERMIAVHRTAVELDPLSVFMKTRLAAKLTDVEGPGQAEATQIIAAVLEEFPDNDYGHEELGNLYRQQGRLADALAAYRSVHFARPGDPYSAAQIAQLALFLGDEPLAETWIAAARERGEDNRRHLHEALQLKGYQDLRGAELGQLDVLIELAWVEQQMSLSSWSNHAASSRRLLRQLRAAGVISIFGFGLRTDYGLARVAAMEQDRPAALAHLRAAVDQGFSEYWFLDRDPVFAAWHDDAEFRAIVAGMLEHAASERATLAGREILP